jgi:aminopeptidase N
VIDAALERDRSSAGRVHAARAQAALGTEEAKAAAWERLMHPSHVSAYELYATGESFFDPAQTELTAPYVARFFTEIGATAEFRSGWSLGEVAVKAYPWSATSEQTLGLAEQALGTDLAAPIRRSLVDATDQLRRAVIALRTYPGAPA